MSRIVVGVDDSAGAADALRWAVQERGIHDHELVAVMAWGWLNQYPAITGATFRAEYDEQDAERALEAIVTGALKPEDAASVERRVVCDLPVHALVDAADGADALVVGARGLGGFGELLLGSVSRRCVEQASVPTVVVRGTSATDALQRIVVGVDGSPGSDGAVSWAVEEARCHDAELVVVHAYQAPFVEAYPYASRAMDVRGAKRAAEEVLERAMAATAGVSATALLECAGGADAVVVAARDAQLVVVGRTGSGSVRRHVLGSVTTQVVHHAPCPVAVIPAT